jgi:hypothetical protein
MYIFYILLSDSQQVHCYDGKTPYQYNNTQISQVPRESISFRYGAEKARHTITNVAKDWSRERAENPPFRVSVVDAWLLTDNRPETTTEGRHWVVEGPSTIKWRAGFGTTVGTSCSRWVLMIDSVLDQIWDDFVTGRTAA